MEKDVECFRVRPGRYEGVKRFVEVDSLGEQVGCDAGFYDDVGRCHGNVMSAVVEFLEDGPSFLVQFGGRGEIEVQGAGCGGIRLQSGFGHDG